MPIHVTWGNEQKTYTFLQFENGWTWDEYYRSIDEANALADECGCKINVLVDISACRVFPQNLLSNIRSAVIQHAGETDVVIVVSTSRLIETLLRTLEKITNKQRLHVRVVRTLEEGRQILAEYDRLHRVSSAAPAADSESVTVPAEPTSLPE